MRINIYLAAFILLIFAVNVFGDIPAYNTAVPRNGTNPVNSGKGTNSASFGNVNAVSNTAIDESMRYAWVSAEIDSKTDAPKLVISRSMLATLNKIAEKEGVSTTGSDERGRTISGVKTVVSGFLASLGLVITGVWLMRSRPGRKVAGLVTALMIFAIGGAGIMIVYGDAAPLIQGVDTFTGRTFSLDVRRSGGAYDRFVRVEIGEDNTDFRLIVPVDSRDKKGGKREEEE